MHRTEDILAVSIAEAARRLGISARTMATLLARRQIRSRKVGRRRIIALTALQSFLEKGQQVADPASALKRSEPISRSGGN